MDQNIQDIKRMIDQIYNALKLVDELENRGLLRMDIGSCILTLDPNSEADMELRHQLSQAVAHYAFSRFKNVKNVVNRVA